jgi:hypothetical protein
MKQVYHFPPGGNKKGGNYILKQDKQLNKPLESN